MSTQPSQSQDRVENITTPVQNFNANMKSTASIQSIPLQKIKTFGSPFSIKSASTIRLCFENVNGLSADVKHWKHNWKHNKLKCLLNRLDADLISLVETQV